MDRGKGIGGRGYLRRGKKIGYKRFESVRGECVSVKFGYRSTIYVMVNTHDS